MKYTVEILPRAIAELRSIVLWWAEHRSTEQAGRWMLQIEAEIAGLADHPERHPPAIEGDRFSFEVREMHVGLNRSKTHRVLFAIRDDVVRIYSVRHLAQDFLTAEEIGLH
jgi:plasmid stabilization system protein ParE